MVSTVLSRSQGNRKARVPPVIAYVVSPAGGLHAWERSIDHITSSLMISTSPDPAVRIRLATLADIVALTHHRASMFRDMGELPEHVEAELNKASNSFFRETVASGEYVAWLAVTSAMPEHVVAGAGLWLRPMLPRPTPTGIIQGHEALVANVYTEPEWRRRGVAALLMRHVLDYTREHRIGRVLLHASDDGRPLYESLGFVPTSEMKLTTST